MKTKVCSTCNIEKAHEDFYRQTKSPDGRAYKCKECHKEYMSGYREGYHKEYYQKNRQKILEQNEAYRRTKKGRWVQFNTNARKRGIEVNLSMQDYFSFLDEDTCNGCGKCSFWWLYQCEGFNDVLELDRIDNDGDYSLDNVQVLCHHCNVRKDCNWREQ